MEVLEETRLVLHRAKFIILLVLQVPSVIISLLIFFFFFTHRALLKDLRRQALLLLLIVNFIQLSVDIPMPIHFYRVGHVSPSTPIYCTWWTFIEYTTEVSAAFLVAVISVQRHILVFHERILHTRWKCILLYYGPLSYCLIYPLTLYTALILLYPCDGSQWDYTSNVCGYANCHLVYNKALAVFDWTAENGVPTVVVLLANIALVLRVIKQKHRHQRRIIWRKQRRLTLQLLNISVLFLIAWLPSLIIALVQQLIDPNFAVEFQSDFALDLIYLMCLFLPWISLGQLPQFRRWTRAQLHRYTNISNNAVRPV